MDDLVKNHSHFEETTQNIMVYQLGVGKIFLSYMEQPFFSASPPQNIA